MPTPIMLPGPSTQSDTEDLPAPRHENQYTARAGYRRAAHSQARYLWERNATDTDKSFVAFEMYLALGTVRSLLKVAEKLDKSHTLINRWSAAHNWVPRALAFDRHNSRLINERVVLGTAEMRQRMVTQALAMQARAQTRILKMTDAEVNALKPSEIVALMRASADMERRARDVDDDEMGFAAESLPNFEIQVISPGEGMVGVQLPDGRCGYIPKEQVERFRSENPSAVVIL
jgi:hypothetical protein